MYYIYIHVDRPEIKISIYSTNLKFWTHARLSLPLSIYSFIFSLIIFICLYYTFSLIHRSSMKQNINHKAPNICYMVYRPWNTERSCSFNCSRVDCSFSSALSLLFASHPLCFCPLVQFSCLLQLILTGRVVYMYIYCMLCSARRSLPIGFGIIWEKLSWATKLYSAPALSISVVELVSFFFFFICIHMVLNFRF